MKTLNSRGFAHFAALALVVLGVATVGTYQLVASHANSLPKTPVGFTVSTGARLDGQTGAFKQTLQARQNDTVEINVNLKNTSKKTINTMYVHDELTRGLTPMTGSLLLNGQAFANSFLNNMNAGSFAPGEAKQITFKAVVSSASKSCNAVALQNIAVASASGFKTLTAKAKIKVCPGAQTPKPVAKTSTVFGARTNGNTAVGFLPALVSQRKDAVEFNAVVTNSGTTALQNATIGFSGLSDKIKVIPSSLTLDGASTTTEVLSKVRLGNFPIGGTHTVHFVAMVSDKATACGAGKMKISAKIVAKSKATEIKTTTIEVCPPANQ